jgi:serine protease inhibitor
MRVVTNRRATGVSGQEIIMQRFSIIILAALCACSNGTEPGRAPDLLTALPRELTADEQRISTAANDFALRLFRGLNAAQPDSNVFVSPLSVSMSLGMAMNGADGATLDQMRSTLGFGSATLEEINRGYEGLMALESGLDPSTTFTIANSVWIRQSLPVHQTFIDEVRATFDAQVRTSPFDATTITAVNDWVSTETNGRIPRILDEIKDEDVMFLINAIYFKGSWRDRFDPAKTNPGTFHAVGGDQEVPMMRREDGAGQVRYSTAQGATVGELLYGNGAFAMTIVVPPATTNIDSFAASLDAAKWESLLAALPEHARDFAVSLPKFTLEYERELEDDLEALGMVVPFQDGPADFARMTTRDVFISFVKHKTFVLVNEEGTEAAAVTNTGAGLTSMPPCLCVNRPFIFVIRERFSGTILFMGKIVRVPT